MTDNQRMIDAAKRAARRTARRTSVSHQTALDQIARTTGRRNWAAFLSDPTDIQCDAGESSMKDDACTVLMIGDPRPEAVYDLVNTADVPVRLMNGEGIVLGIDEDARTVRSARSSIVVCTGHPGTAKSLSTALCTIASSPDSSQIVYDTKGDLLAATMALSLRSHTNIVILDAEDVCSHESAERVFFNPLHPAFRTRRDDAWSHAMVVATAIVDIPDARRAEHCRLLFALFVARMCGTHGRPSITGMTTEITDHFLRHNGKRLGLEGLRIHALTGEARTAMEVMDALPPDELAIVVDDLWTAVHYLRIPVMHPERYDRGGEIATMLSDPARPLSLFLVDTRRTRNATRRVHDLALEMTGRIRAALPHRERALQLIIDDAGWMKACAWTAKMARTRAPAGTSVLLVFQHINQRHGAWNGYDTKAGSERADHVLAFQKRMNQQEMELIDRMLRRGSERTSLPEPHEDGRHIVFDEKDDDHRSLRTTYILPPRRPRWSE